MQDNEAARGPPATVNTSQSPACRDRNHIRVARTHLSCGDPETPTPHIARAQSDFR